MDRRDALKALAAIALTGTAREPRGDQAARHQNQLT